MVQLIGGPDGLVTFETSRHVSAALVSYLVYSGVSFYYEPWVDGLFHVTVNGKADSRIAAYLDGYGYRYTKIGPRKEA